MTAAHTLPEAVTSFVGRRAELAATRARMSESRLVTLTGAPGAGKTRLAVQVAAGSGRAFPGGVWMVDLASLDDPGKVAQTVVEALEVPDHSARPPEDKLVDHLRDRLALVLLDNCEHVHARARAASPWRSTASTSTRCRHCRRQRPPGCWSSARAPRGRTSP